MNTEQVVYLLRKTSLTRTEIGKLTPAQFNEIIKETYFQESVDNYRNQHSVASLMAAIYNTIPQKRGSKTFKASDFLKSEMPERNPKADDSIDKLAKDRGIKLPSKELKER
jgi:hypothetical protein